MILKNVKSIQIVDNIIFFFALLFLASLTNSIFVNQLGYYGALVFILVKFSLTRKNPFNKTGLEIFFLLFIAAEIVSTILSNNFPQAFNNLLKRVLLLPIVYVAVASADSNKKAELFFKVYIGFAVLSAAIYLFNSYQYFITGLFSIKGSGPSIFQYPITTSELLSFTVIFLFAFLINEKGNYKNKFVILIGFLISAAALAATYKRTGWLGVAAGIVFILILRKKYVYLIPVALIIGYLLLTAKNESKVYIYENQDGNYTQSASFDTEGRAFSILPDSNKFYLSDYEKGLLTYKNKTVVDSLDFPEPVIEFMHWDDSLFCAAIIDTRFYSIRKNNAGKFEILKELLSPGYTRQYKIRNDYLYILDSDSGLSMFSPSGKGERFKDIKNNVWFDVDSNYMVLVSVDREMTIYKLDNFLPDELMETPEVNGHLNFIDLMDGELYFSDSEGIKKYDFQNKRVTSLKVNFDDKIYNLYSSGNKLFAVATTGTIYEINKEINDTLVANSVINAGFIPQSLAYSGNKLYLTKVKRSRLASIFDPYLPSNTVRISLWTAGWKIFKDNPVFGVGDIDLAHLYIKYKSKYDKEIQGHLHNNYVHLLAILGTFGFLAVMFLLGKIFFVNIKIYNEIKDIPFASSFALGAAGSFVSFLVAGLTEWNFGDHEIITMIWFITGLNYAFYYLNKKNTDVYG